MNRWALLYWSQIKALGAANFYKIKIKEKKTLLDTIVRYSSKDSRILEAGCGTGVLSLYLAQQGFDVTGVDIDYEMLEISKYLTQKFAINQYMNVVQADLINLPFPDKSFDITHSHGVLEHFDDISIQNILKEQLRVSQKVIISIPSNFFTDKERMYGDERFLSPAYWQQLIYKLKTVEILEWFSFDYHTGIQRVFSTVRRFLYAKGVKPYLVFVIREIQRNTKEEYENVKETTNH